MKKRLLQIQKTLQSLEWSGETSDEDGACYFDGGCPSYGADKEEGHRPRCSMKIALRNIQLCIDEDLP
jgi:hypothetical protein